MKPRKHLLSIAIGDYAHWQPLQGPRADAQALLEILTERYGFDRKNTQTLVDQDATVRNTRAVFEDLVGVDSTARRTKSKEFGQDDLLVFFAGHGHWDPVFQTGYWIPHDGGTDAHARENWLPLNEVIGVLAALPFRHVLLICDACFAGTMLKRDIGLATVRYQDDYVKQASSFRAREVLTSVGEESTPDVGIQGHSPFAFHLLDVLKNATDPWLDKLSLYDRIRRSVPKARCGDLEQAGHQQGGAFILQSSAGDAQFAHPETTNREQLERITDSMEPALPHNNPAEAAKRNPGVHITADTNSPPSVSGAPRFRKTTVAEWYFLLDGRTKGPVTLETMGNLLKSRQIDSNTLLWKQTYADWYPVSSVAEVVLAGMQ